jgi:hypothetical protein
MRAQCPNCNHHVRYKAEVGGQEIQCPTCEQPMLLPSADDSKAVGSKSSVESHSSGKSKFWIFCIAVGIGITFYRNSVKRAERAEQVTQQVHEVFESARRETKIKSANDAELRSKVEGILEILDNYSIEIQGIAEGADAEIASIKMLADAPEYKRNASLDPSGASRLFHKVVSDHYSNFQKLIRNLCETFEDKHAQDRLSNAMIYASTLPDERQKNLLIAIVAICDKAQEDLDKYRNRQRFEAKDQIEQMRDCSKRLAGSIVALKAAQMQASDVFAKKR